MASSVVLATAGYDHTIRYSRAGSRVWLVLLPKGAWPRRVRAAGATCPPQARLPAPCSAPACCRFWEATSGICYRTLQYADSQVNKLEITADKTLIAAAGNPHIRLFEVNSNNPQPILSYDGHAGNVTSVGFQKDGKWMFSGSEDGTVKIWDLRAPGCQREYESRAAVNTVILHPNQGELISGARSLGISGQEVSSGLCGGGGGAAVEAGCSAAAALAVGCRAPV